PTWRPTTPPFAVRADRAPLPACRPPPGANSRSAVRRRGSSSRCAPRRPPCKQQRLRAIRPEADSDHQYPRIFPSAITHVSSTLPPPEPQGETAWADRNPDDTTWGDDTDRDDRTPFHINA